MPNLLLIILCSFSIFANANEGRIVNIVVNGKSYQAKEGVFLVRHKPGLRTQSAKQLDAMANAEVKARFSHPEGLELVKVKPSASAKAALKVYQQSSDILYVEPDYIWHSDQAPNDPMLSSQWSLNSINALQAWGLTTGSQDVVLGTIDTGADYTHPDLAASMWTNPGEIPDNGIDDDGNGYIDDVHGINAIDLSGDPMDDNMHGTHVAGIIAAQQNNGIGVSGVAPNASVAACKFLDASGSGDTAGAILCLNYYLDLATRPVDPVHIVATNNSWAGGPYSQALYDAIKANQDAGILFMAAASNDGQNNDNVATYPSNFYLSNVISVAATDSNDQLASFSNYGRLSVSVAAPGVDILSTVPNAKYAYLSGTSMATPSVTGLAGLIASYYPNMSWINIKNLILSGGATVAGSSSTTISGRRISAADTDGTGSLTCVNQKILRRVLPRQSSVSLKLGQGLNLGILNITCESPTGAQSAKMTAMIANAPLVLSDKGQGVDQVAGDGIFSGTWTPTARGTYRLAFPGNDIVTVQVQ